MLASDDRVPSDARSVTVKGETKKEEMKNWRRSIRVDVAQKYITRICRYREQANEILFETQNCFFLQILFSSLFRIESCCAHRESRRNSDERRGILIERRFVS